MSSKFCNSRLSFHWRSKRGGASGAVARAALLELCGKCAFTNPIQMFVFCSKVLSESKKCHFRDTNFKNFPRGHAPGPP